MTGQPDIGGRPTISFVFDLTTSIIAVLAMDCSAEISPGLQENDSLTRHRDLVSLLGCDQVIEILSILIDVNLHLIHCAAADVKDKFVAVGLTPDVAVVADCAGLVSGTIGAGRQGESLVQVGRALHVLEPVGVALAGLDEAADKDIGRTALALLALLLDDGAEGLGGAHLAQRLD